MAELTYQDVCKMTYDRIEGDAKIAGELLRLGRLDLLTELYSAYQSAADAIRNDLDKLDILDADDQDCYCDGYSLLLDVNAFLRFLDHAVESCE